MEQYLKLLECIKHSGTIKSTRAILPSTGKNVYAYSLFGYQFRFNLSSDSFPAITTKKLALNAVTHELLWMISGSTNVKDLQKDKVKIWDEWADENGELGPIYGKQWRDWVCPDGRHIDQLKKLLDDIQKVKKDPNCSEARRLILTAWNPADIEAMALPPCHCFSQFHITGGRLSCQLYQRSADAFLGVPFNIASYALLTHLIAHVSDLGVDEFIHTFGDVHIYENHIDAVNEQLKRKPFDLPTIEIDPGVKDLFSIRRDDIQINNYQSHPVIKAEIAI